MTLSGLVCVRNGNSLDYCWREAVHSLLPVVDEMVICDADSTDDTSESIALLALHYSKIRVINFPWRHPQRNLFWWVEWLNWAREQLRSPMVIQLDADEVLDPIGYETIRKIAMDGGAAFFKRYNYWRNTQCLAPHGRACGVMVARLGPSALYLPSDEPFPRHSPNIRTAAMAQENKGEYPDLFIHHLGFLRESEAFVKKSEVVQNAFFGSVDPRIADQAATGSHWVERDYFDGVPLDPAERMIPEVAHGWLRERGYCP